MLRIDTIDGNVHEDESLAAAADRHETRGTLERVAVDARTRKKSHLRVTSDAGTDLGVVVDRPELAAGDVLHRDDDRMIVVTVESREALVVDLPEDTSLTAAAELGHRVGNQHWDLATSGRTLYVSLDADRRIAETVLDDHLPDGADVRVETVDHELFVEDRSGATPDHGHGDHDHGDGDHSHDGHGHVDHGHDHSDHGHMDHGHDHSDHGHDHDEAGDHS
jgi:urease accessory protein